MCAKRLADDTILNEGFIEDYSTPKKRPRIEQSDTPSSSRKKSYSVDFKLKLVDEANKTSIAAISKKYSVDRKCIRRWIHSEEALKKLLEDQPKGAKRSNLAGQGRKVANEEMEEALYEWIAAKRSKAMHVSRTEICRKAKELSMDCSFVASQCWLKSFMGRYDLCLRRKTHVSQRLPGEICEKVYKFLLFVLSFFKRHTISPSHIYAADETSVILDAVSSDTVDFKGAKTITLKTTGHDKLCVSVMLLAASDGKKKKPYIVFRGVGKNKHAKALREANPEVVIGYSASGWFNNDIIEDWLDQFFPDTCFFNRLLVWDSFRAHISDQTKEVIKRKRMHQALIPGGCTNHSKS